MKFSCARAAIMWAWWSQFECLVGSNPLDLDSIGGGTINGNISDGLARAIDIKRWLEQAAFKAGLESINPILLSELSGDAPANLPTWQQRRVDKALVIFEGKLDQVGWLEEKGCIPKHELL